MNRKNTIIAVLMIVALLGVGYYYFSKVKQTTTPTNPSFGDGTGTTIIGGLPAPTGESDFTPGSSDLLPRLYELHKTAVAGTTFTETGSGANLSISARYVDRSLGNIFDTPLSSYVETRIVNETRPGISEAFWTNNGKTVVMRYLEGEDRDAIITRIINITETQATDTGDTSDSFFKTEEISLPDYISFTTTSGDNSNKIFYLENTGVSALGHLTSSKGGISKIFESAITEWLPQFPNKNLITLTTKPSESVPGYMFFLNPTTKSLNKVLSGINGLTTLTNKDGKFVLYSESIGGLPELSVYDTIKKTSSQLSLKTLPEKCVWSSKESHIAYCAVPLNPQKTSYPDAWYQGRVSFSDELVRVDAKTNTSEPIMSPSTFTERTMDIINPTLSSNDSYILFMNKTSGTPWVYKLKDSQ